MKIIGLSPVEMTGDVMEVLERRGLITRLCPNHDELAPPLGEIAVKTLYEPKEGYGAHKLISVTVNREEFAGFGVHPDNEEFWLIGDADTQPMYLAVSLLSAEELDSKIAGGSLESSDFITLRVKYNDPWVSFFVMHANVPHGEAIVNTGKRPPTFYVTESRDLPLPLTDMGDYRLKVLSE
ncbi:MAG: hypothetical protein LBS53_02970 [Synergistaceae bacterium]|jgi:hypothetical protein|nr:hypothetical protein [Synergistaceae bacterium]